MSRLVRLFFSTSLKEMSTTPTVKLDATLTELYRRASPENATRRIAQVLCGTNSGMSLTRDFPRNIKYLYQDSAFTKVPSEELDESHRELRRSLAMKHLSLVPQRDAFIAGKTPVILFNTGQSRQQLEDDRRDIKPRRRASWTTVSEPSSSFVLDLNRSQCNSTTSM